MTSKVSRIERVLVYADRATGPVGDISDWRPFPDGDHLGQIIGEYNKRCQKAFHRFFTGLSDTQTQGVIYCLALDPIVAGADPVVEAHASAAKIVILDLEAAARAPEVVSRVSEQLTGCQQVIYLIQLAERQDHPSQADSFSALSHLFLPDPQVFHGQAELTAFLSRLQKAYVDAWLGAVQNPFDKAYYVSGPSDPHVSPRHGRFIYPKAEVGRVIRYMYRDYHTMLPEIVADVRDVALLRGLSQEQTVNLGRAAAIQEFALIHLINLLDPQPKHWVSVEPVRQSLFSIPVAMPLGLDQVQAVDLLELSLYKKGVDAPPDIRKRLAELGFIEQISKVVWPDRPELWEQIRPLEALLQIRPFTAELPDWREPPAIDRIRFDSTAFGVSSKE